MLHSIPQMTEKPGRSPFAAAIDRSAQDRIEDVVMALALELFTRFDSCEAQVERALEQAAFKFALSGATASYFEFVAQACRTHLARLRNWDGAWHGDNPVKSAIESNQEKENLGVDELAGEIRERLLIAEGETLNKMNFARALAMVSIRVSQKGEVERRLRLTEEMIAWHEQAWSGFVSERKPDLQDQADI